MGSRRPKKEESGVDEFDEEEGERRSRRRSRMTGEKI